MPLAIPADQTAAGCMALLIVKGVDQVGYVRARNPADLQIGYLTSRVLRSLKAVKGTRSVAAHQLHHTMLIARISDSSLPESRRHTSRCRSSR